MSYEHYVIGSSRGPVRQALLPLLFYRMIRGGTRHSQEAGRADAELSSPSRKLHVACVGPTHRRMLGVGWAGTDEWCPHCWGLTPRLPSPPLLAVGRDGKSERCLSQSPGRHVWCEIRPGRGFGASGRAGVWASEK